MLPTVIPIIPAEPFLPAALAHKRYQQKVKAEQRRLEQEQEHYSELIYSSSSLAEAYAGAAPPATPVDWRVKLPVFDRASALAPPLAPTPASSSSSAAASAPVAGSVVRAALAQAVRAAQEAGVQSRPVGASAAVDVAADQYRGVDGKLREWGVTAAHASVSREGMHDLVPAPFISLS